MDNQRYPSDLTDSQWHPIKGLLPPPAQTTGEMDNGVAGDMDNGVSANALATGSTVIAVALSVLQSALSVF